MLKTYSRLGKGIRILFGLMLVAGLLYHLDAGAQTSTNREITVSAAISLKNAYEEIGKMFMERNPGVKVNFNFGASGDLARQIEAGAPVDVFASAAQKDMDDIGQKGLIAAGSRKNFAKNGVVLVKPSNSNIPLRSLADLQLGEVKKIVIGNPKTVPAGRYAEDALRHFKPGTPSKTSSSLRKMSARRWTMWPGMKWMPDWSTLQTPR